MARRAEALFGKRWNKELVEYEYWRRTGDTEKLRRITDGAIFNETVHGPFLPIYSAWAVRDAAATTRTIVWC